jgi:hypothetical protein
MWVDHGVTMNTLRKFSLYLTVFFSLSLVACTSTIAPTQTSLPPPVQASQTLEPTRTATPINPPSTSSPQQLTAAAQLEHMASVRETATARGAIQTVNAPTLTPIPTLPTGEVLEVLEAIRKPEETWAATSPDGQWVITVINQCADIGERSYSYEQEKFSQTDGTSSWVLYEELGNCGPGGSHFSPIHWSPDSHYFYYARITTPDGCGYVEGGDPISQVDVKNQYETPLTTARNWQTSPDQQTLAMIGGNELVLWNLNLGQTARVILIAPGTGEQVIWKPDGSALMVTTVETVYCELPKNSSLVRMDLPELEQTTYFTADTRLLFAAEWLDTGMVVLRSFNYGNQPSWFLDPQTGEVTPPNNPKNKTPWFFRPGRSNYKS